MTSRASGVLLHPTSLDGPFGIGDLGPAAFRFVDWLHDAGQRLWQVLPIGPTGSGGSPYSSLSTMAGNELLVSPQRLFEAGWIERKDLELAKLERARVDFEAVARSKRELLATAFRRRDREACERFRSENRSWVEDWALFRAISNRRREPFWRWPAPVRSRRRGALRAARRELADEIEQEIFVQCCFWSQWNDLRQHAHAKGIRLVGDIPFYIGADSADVWLTPHAFKVDPHSMKARFVGGVPPDAFSETGQRWGMPCFAWWKQRLRRFSWWMQRFDRLANSVDVVRIDHFRGLAACWEIPADAPDARTGRWVPAPGNALLRRLNRRLPQLELWAEDLGYITEDVIELRDRFAVAATRVLHYAFDGGDDNWHRPNHHPENAVVYTGTHDNDTTRGWWDSLDDERRRKVADLSPGVDADNVHEKLIELALASRARACVLPLQDALGLDAEARMNLPGTIHGNWGWRVHDEQLSADRASWLRERTTANAR